MEVRETTAFTEWLAKLKDSKARARIAVRLRLFARGHMGDAKALGDGVQELRVHFGPGYRVYVARRGEIAALILGGGDKSSQRRDIEKAKALAAEWRRQWD